MEIRVSQRASAIKPSATLAIAAKAIELRAAGRDIISLSAGEPDFDTPEHVKEAAIAAMRAGFTKYTPIEGTASLRQAVAAKFERENGLRYSPAQVIVSCGAKHSLYNLFEALVNTGDEVIVPAPYWVSYADMARLAGGSPVIIKTGIEHDFKMTPEQLRGAITRQTRLVILNSPSNPTGAHYTPEELAELGDILREHPGIVVCSDDIYEHILWDGGPFRNILNVCPDLAPRTVVVNGVSKAYAMTGWRIGYAAGPQELINAMKKIQSQSTSNPTSIAQVAAEAALTGDQSLIARQCAVFRERHDFVIEQLNALPGVRVRPGQGTFYAFPDMRGAIDRLDGVDDDTDLARLLLERADIAAVPGVEFGAPGYLRLSFATSMENLQKAMARLRDALA